MPFIELCYVNFPQTYPAANIIGRSGAWLKTGIRSKHSVYSPQSWLQIKLISIYNNYITLNYNYIDTDGNRITAWNCNYGGAFVDGGMIFNLTDKKLYVPVCGYYYISSQVQFASYQRNKTDYAQHQLIVEPKCADQRPTITTNAYSYGTNETEWVTATHTGRVFKLCNGGSVYIRVPQKKGNACCPRGKHDTTFISAHLVREMSCP